MTVVLTGLLTCLALIVAIGPQSVWLIRQGLRRDHVMLALGACLLGDIFLVSLGTGGVGAALEHAPWLLEVLRWIGVGYLLWFAYRSVRSARAHHLAGRPAHRAGRTTAGTTARAAVPVSAQVTMRDGGSTAASNPVAEVEGLVDAGADPAGIREQHSRPGGVVLAGLAVSVLNPHSWVDTLVVLGSMANSFGDQRWLFAAGAVIASLIWFSALSFGGAALAGVLNRPRTWVVIDTCVAATMVGVAGMLAVHGV